MAIVNKKKEEWNRKDKAMLADDFLKYMEDKVVSEKTNETSYKIGSIKEENMIRSALQDQSSYDEYKEILVPVSGAYFPLSEVMRMNPEIAESVIRYVVKNGKENIKDLLLEIASQL